MTLLLHSSRNTSKSLSYMTNQITLKFHNSGKTNKLVSYIDYSHHLGAS